MEIEIIPTILTAELDEFEEELHKIEPVADWVQIDYVDGFFAPEVSCCEAHVIREIETDVSLEVQLMVVDPLRQVRAWANAGVDRIIGHIEEMEDQTIFVERVSEFGLGVGLALNLDSSVRAIDENLIPSLDLILLMAHEVGIQGGLGLDKAVYKKIEYFRELNEDIDIEIDGGVNADNVLDLVKAGATMLAVGSGIFAQDDPVQAYLDLRELVNSR